MTNINLKHALQNDNVYVETEMRDLSLLTGLKTRRGLEKVVLSAGEIVNVVSDNYGHLPNQIFYKAVEDKLEGINYIKRSINRGNRSFAVDYILNDDKYVVTIKNGLDKIKPMLRFVNSYDGSAKTSGHFGFFREICSNGLHVSQSIVGFSMLHKGSITNVVMPEIKLLVSKFMDNEFYTIQRKFEVLAETPIEDLTGWVKMMCNATKIFKFECSEKNPAPSLNARTVIETIQNESYQLREQPNLWLGYNAFNEILHGKLQKSFELQKNLDAKIFEMVETN